MNVSLLRAAAVSPVWFSLVIGAALVGYQQVVGPLPQLVQWAVLGAALLLAGIPHGALDHLVEQQTRLQAGRSFQLTAFLGRYLLTIAFYGAMWWLWPGLSLVAFLLFSAWHFGETDLDHAPAHSMLWNVVRFWHGVFVLAFLLLGHAAETTPILASLTNNQPDVMNTWATLSRNAPDWLWNGSGWLLRLLIVAQLAVPGRVNWLRAVQLAVLLGLCQLLPLLPAFALYFGGWHSLAAFEAIRQHLRASATDARMTAWQLWQKAIPFTALALVGMVGIGWVWRTFGQQIDPVPVVFMFLSLITLPHLNVMHGMIRQRALSEQRVL
jgi:beta-carotene 15,15'-dioxygenase